MILPDILVLDGAVGSGKGTQATLLAQKNGFYQFGFGTELRHFVSQFSEHPEHPNYLRAMQIKELMRVGENVSPDDLFFAAGEKITNLIELGRPIVIDSVKTMGAFEWLAATVHRKQLRGLLVHLQMDIQTSLDRLTNRFYVPGLSEIPFNSYDEALKHCQAGQLPIRREDDLNIDRIHNQYKIYHATHATVQQILVEQGGFECLEIEARDNVESISDQIQAFFQAGQPHQYPLQVSVPHPTPPAPQSTVTDTIFSNNF